jgi:colanic acid/amylovoran biosynthesis glycosyltransferase
MTRERLMRRAELPELTRGVPPVSHSDSTVARVAEFDPHPAGMRIAYLVDRFPCASNAFILQEIRDLESLGVDVHVFPLSRPASAVGTTASALPLRRPVDYVLADLAGSPASGLLTKQAHVLARLTATQQIDHVHAHGTTTTTDLARAVEMLANVGFSFTAHADGLYDAVNAPSLGGKIDAARFVVTFTELDRHRLIRIAGPRSARKVHHVPLGLNPDDFHFTAPEYQDSVSVLAVAPLPGKSGLTDLIDAIATLRDRSHVTRLTIVGVGGFEDAVRARIDQRGLSRVRVISDVSSRQLEMLMRGHSTLALPWVDGGRSRESLIHIALQAMALGLPVVSADFPGVREIIDDGISGRVIPVGDREWLAGALDTLFASSELRKRMARRARSAVEQRFSSSRTAGQLIQLFGRVVSGSQLPA